MTDTLSRGDHLILVDGSSYIFRAYHALPPLTRKSDGLPVGAVSGFCNMLWKLLRDSGDDGPGGVPPTHVAVIFDHSGRSFRNKIYPEYKAHRPPPPEDLVPQFGLIRDAVRAFSVACVEQEGYEADDIIATYAVAAAQSGATVTIVASDKDLMQLIRPGVTMLDTMKNKVINAPEVFDKFGVAPEKVIDVQALAGDSTDNVPGVPGIGIKTAAQLITEFGDVETLLQRAGEIKQNKRRENLIEHADLARVSRDLVTLKTDVPVTVPLSGLSVQPDDPAKLVGFLKAMGFTTLTRRVATETETDADTVDAASVPVEGWDGGPAAHGPDMDVSSPETADGWKPQSGVERIAAALAKVPIDLDAYSCVTKTADLEHWIEEATNTGHVAFDTETTSLDAMRADLVGFSLATAPGRACYVPVGHTSGDGLDFGDGDQLKQIPLAAALERLKPLLEAPGVLKIGQNLKYDMLVLKRYGIHLTPHDDTMLMSYALDGGRGGHGMDELAARHLGHTCISFKDVAGSGKAMITFDRVSLEKATPYAAEDADVTLRLWLLLRRRLVAERMTTVYERLERPLVGVLAGMEEAGVTVDRQILSRLSGDFAQGMAALEAEAHELAGESFNLGSPKQLGEILFDKLGLPGGKKTKTGAWATGAGVLEDLATKGLELPIKMLQWRQLSKLKSTYTDALPGFVNPESGRVHTSFALAATTTGRLSSSDPNIQNIPIRTDEGRKIRAAFVASPGKTLISADYSQIELRVLAHIADITQLKQAFADGLDIHAMTASEMFSVPIEGMDPMVRRRAKAINFGIIYGISAFGLANQLGITRSEAGDYIARYFERFPGIKDYMDTTKQTCHAQGYVSTIFGRKCHYPEINTKNPNMRAFLERAAINAPVQGSAADIIRRAMIRMPAALDDAGLGARMLLQVHDELVFEADESERDETIAVATSVMENAAHPVVDLSVPLVVEARAADNWDEAH